MTPLVESMVSFTTYEKEFGEHNLTPVNASIMLLIKIMLIHPCTYDPLKQNSMK